MEKTHPPKPRLTLRVGISGHRPNRLGEGAADRLRSGIKDLFQAMLAALDEVRVADGDVVSAEAPLLRAVSPLAEGSDCIFARAARELGVPLFAPLPFARGEYEKDFSSEAARKEFRALCEQASVFEFVHERVDQELAYESVGLFTLRQCDVLIAVWDGKAGSGRGGTQEMLTKASAAGVPILRFDEKGDGPWILPWKIRRAEATAEALLDGTVPATPLALKELIEGIVAPPRESGQPAGEQRKRLKRFLNERERLKNFWFAFPLMQRLLTPWRRFRQSLFPAPYVASTVKYWRESFWIHFAGVPETSETASEQLAAAAPRGVFGLLEERYAWADKLAVHFAQVYRSSYVSIFMLGAVAVVCALLVVIANTKPYSSVVELLVISAAPVIVLIGSWRQWHKRWLDYRQLAEQLRALRLLALTGSNGARFRVEHGDEGEEATLTWTDWYLRATAREIEMPHGVADARYGAAIERALLEGEIKSQVAFHAANAKRQKHMEHRLDAVGLALFAATALVLMLYLGLFVYDYHWAHELSPWVTFLSALLPSFGAALFAIRAQGDFDESARLSTEMIARLRAIEIEIARQKASSFANISRLVEDAAGALSADLSDWRLLYRGKPLTLAG
ncbi:MAG: hypothetical protein K8S25_06360 [Alphaproteobacteria bacterium]|nr:hypothetical protein [Alphaproteobacteria bacterium]